MLGTYAAAAMTHSWPPTASRTPVVNMFGQFPCVAQRLFSIYKLLQKRREKGGQSRSPTHLLLISTSMVVMRTTQVGANGTQQEGVWWGCKQIVLVKEQYLKEQYLKEQYLKGSSKWAQCQRGRLGVEKWECKPPVRSAPPQSEPLSHGEGTCRQLRGERPALASSKGIFHKQKKLLFFWILSK